VGASSRAEIIRQERSVELPTFTPYRAVVAVIERFQDQWRAHTMAYLEAISKELSAEIQAQLKRRFDRFPMLRTLL
jgi:hypothetical protein